MKYLLSNTIFFLLLIFSVSGQNGHNFDKIWDDSTFNPTQVNQYRTLIQTPKYNFSGVTVVVYKDSVLKGSVMNEFGFKSFDFIITQQSCQLLNVITFIDKPFIKKTIASDLFFMFNIDNENYAKRGKCEIIFSDSTLIIKYKKNQRRPIKEIIRYSNSEIVYRNNQHSLIYSFQKMD